MVVQFTPTGAKSYLLIFAVNLLDDINLLKYRYGFFSNYFIELAMCNVICMDFVRNVVNMDTGGQDDD